MKKISLRKNKKGVSIMIGYILLISIAVVIALSVYGFLRTWIPKDIPKCQEDVSLLITQLTCDNPPGDVLALKLKNNGLFNVSGYFIKARTQSGEGLATFDLATLTPEGQQTGYISFVSGLAPGEEMAGLDTFDLSGGTKIYSVEIVPIVFIEDEKKIERVVSCDQSAIKEEIACG